MEKAQYAIMRFAKYKGPEIGNIEAHNERTKEKYASNPDVDISRSKYNFHLVKTARQVPGGIGTADCRCRMPYPEGQYPYDRDAVHSQHTRSRVERNGRKFGCFSRKLCTFWNSISPKRQLYPPWCIWTRKRPICTFVLSL